MFDSKLHFDTFAFYLNVCNFAKKERKQKGLAHELVTWGIRQLLDFYCLGVPVHYVNSKSSSSPGNRLCWC